MSEPVSADEVTDFSHKPMGVIPQLAGHPDFDIPGLSRTEGTIRGRKYAAWVPTHMVDDLLACRSHLARIAQDEMNGRVEPPPHE